MKTVDFLRVAIKHLNFCEKVLNSSESKDENDLIDIYYILGYVFEGFAVYIAYKLEYGDDKIVWDDLKDIDDDFFDIDFSSASHLAYHDKSFYQGKLVSNLKKAREQGCLDLSQGPDYYINKSYLYSKVSQSSLQGAEMNDKELQKMMLKKLDAVGLNFCVTNHAFNRPRNLVDRCVRPKFHGFVSEYGTLPYFGDPPDIKNAEEAMEYEEQVALIRSWETSFRYKCGDDEHLKEGIKEKITEKNLRKLTECCKKIFELIPSYLPHHKGAKK
ncbi:MAG: hypothetical protein IKO21_02515 [Fibrobacter sp.]|nr:hypothetical protein [Fibrobacter sp.]